MPHRKTGPEEVLEFYRTLPFNFHSTPEAQARSLRQENSVLSRPILAERLEPDTRVLDVGCGAGWLANSISYYYGASVLGIDFNPVAVERARAVSRLVGSTAEFVVADLFEFTPNSGYDLVVSEGVLHHTRDCHAAVRRCCREYLRQGGWLYVGLYHQYGRAPFLEHFDSLRAQGIDEDSLCRRFAELFGSTRDTVHMQSWFRDQVLHPHETQHTLEEMYGVLVEEGMELVSTSINHFEPIVDVAELFAMEPAYRQRGEQRLREGKYFPGFFIFLARKM